MRKYYSPTVDMENSVSRAVYGKNFHKFKKRYGKSFKKGYSGTLDNVVNNHVYKKNTEYKRAISQQIKHPTFIAVKGPYENNRNQVNEYDSKNTEIPFPNHPVGGPEEKKVIIKDNSPRGEIERAVNEVIGIPEDIDKFELAMINQFPAEGTAGHMIKQLNEREETEQPVDNVAPIPAQNIKMEISQAIDKARDMPGHPMEAEIIHPVVDQVKSMPEQHIQEDIMNKELFIDPFDPFLNKNKMGPMPYLYDGF